MPVIVMSAYTDIASTAGAFRGGAYEFLSKPFDLDAAVAALERPGHPAIGDLTGDGRPDLVTGGMHISPRTGRAKSLMHKRSSASAE